ncbi:MAG: glycoside hydrolase family 1 protein [Atopobiaceae bacterium]|nr:glycoside hydrolase family 1 protein [Atopobiaceae bacterium]MCH4180573.1 glycoside hydrolase family 1 protein [Atopobiaceae bacterium]MCH4214298.1 glycoside hydrolase family 1 protein [Atopobiaceae bacterium]MCH4230575.1 glycoside hydrolase family 1 protein [Atopobiaceae bacterium]MCH4276123.1 glycoside hydrolase family 1 protein [Atopobiaceae bacterium]
MSEVRLPEGFFLGAAMSAAQVEGARSVGGKLPSTWDLWSDLALEDFHNHVGSDLGNDFYHRYESDLDLLKGLGLTSFRTSISWSRLLDQDGNINPEGAAFYHRLFAYAARIGLEVFVTLYHFDLPAYLFRRGGWESRDTVEAFSSYASRVFAEFGQEVRYWFTFNEPIVEPENRYLYGGWYPFVHDFGRCRRAQYHISLAHSLGVYQFRRAQEAGVVRDDAMIGLVSSFAPAYTRDDPSDADLEALRMSDGLANRWWLDLVCKGTLPSDVIDPIEASGVDLDRRPGDDAVLALGTVDWLGCNYYQPNRVQAPARTKGDDGQPIFADPYIWPDRVMNESRGWEVYPKGLYDFGLKIRDEYPGLAWYVSENGMGIEGESAHRDEAGTIQDGYRIDFTAGHLAWLVKAIEEGSDCRGYHSWGVIDNWSWDHAYKNRYGFIEVDLDHDLERRPKASAAWLKEVCRTRGFEWDPEVAR